MSDVVFRAVISAEELQAMVKEHVARTIRGHRVSTDENGDPVEWEESTIAPLIRSEVERLVGAAVQARVETTIAEIVKDGLAMGFLVKGDWQHQEQRLSVKDFVNRYLTMKTRGEGYNGHEMTAPERIISAVVEDAMRKDFAKVVEELRVTFKTALTAKFQEAAAEALRRAVGL